MFFTTQLNFDDPNVYQKFEFDPKDHQASWEHYYKIYNKALALTIKKGLTGNYAFNGAAHGLMFLLRHVIELNLKYNLALNGLSVPNTHCINDLLLAFTDQAFIPDPFKQAIQIFISDDDGACWRYFADKDGAAYFGKADTIELQAIIRQLNTISSTATFKMLPVSEPFDYNSSKIKWDLTLHIGQVDNDWHVKGEFDILTIMLIGMIDAGDADVKDIYLPVLYNIRHGIELALKGNIGAIQPVSTEISQKNVDGEHSLCGLHNVFKGFLDKVDWTRTATKTQQQYRDYRAKYDQLNDALHQLDSHSRAFRFPFDRNGDAHRLNLAKTEIRELIKLYQLTDAFLVFTTNVLIDNNLLPFDPEVHG